MANVCVVASCNTRKNTDKASAIKCFSFPKDPDLKTQWLNLCQVDEDHNKKVCIKHFKEDDFVDGLKARLMSVQPTRLKKDAIPSLFLNPDLTEENKEKQIQNQEEMLRKYLNKKKRQVRISKGSKVRTSNSSKGSMEYLSKLVPIAPKGVGTTIVSTTNKVVIPKDLIIPPKERIVAPKERIIVPKEPMLAPMPSLAPNYQTIAVKEFTPSEESAKVPTSQNETVSLSNDSTTSLNPISNITPVKTLILQSETNKAQKHESIECPTVNHFHPYSMHQFKVLQHDNAIYKKRINTLIENQNKLLAKIKDLEATVESQKEDYIGKVKESFANILTSNQIDNVLGIKKHIWWTNEEYAKALKLLHISKQGYQYVKENLNYPLPCIPNVYKWSTKHDLTKKSVENKENSKVDDQVMKDQTMTKDDQMNDDEVKSKIKSEYAKEDKKILPIEYDPKDDKNYATKIDDGKVDAIANDNVCDGVDHYSNGDNNDEHHNVNEINHLKVTVEIDCNNQDQTEIDHVIRDHDIIMNSDQEFYEVLIVDNDYSDYDEIYADIPNVGYIEKDNG